MCKERPKVFFSIFLIQTVFILCNSYRVEVTINDDGKVKDVSAFEIVKHDNPPFDIEYGERNFKDGKISYFGDSVSHKAVKRDRRTDMKRMQSENLKENGVKVSGFLGNIRRKRSLNQLAPECVKSESDSGESNKAVTVEVGETIHLPCHDCSEDDTEMFESMEWIKLDQYPDAKGLYRIKEVLPDLHDDEKHNRVSVTLDHSLVFKNAQLSDTGSYFYKPSDMSGTFMNLRLDWNELQEYISRESHMRYYFHVDVIDLNHAETIDVSSYSNRQPLKPEVIQMLNIEVATKWHPWTSCSVCDDDGIRKRMGLCVVNIHDSSRPVPHNYLRNILRFAGNGIPCKSQFLRDFWQEPWLKKPNQIQIEECNVPCQSVTSKRRTRDAKILTESELQDENVKTVHKKMKAKQKTVKTGSYFILKCPGISLTKTINWVNGTALLHIIKVQQNSNNRITQDMFGNLHFKTAELSDGGTYSCWIKKEIKQKYEIKIEEDKRTEMIKYTVYLCISFVCDFMAFVALAVIKFLQRKVQHRKQRKGKESAEESDDSSTENGEADDESSSSD